MTQFLVIVTCVAHYHNCPIPQGYRSVFPAENKSICEERAKKVVEAFGYKLHNYTIVCERQ